MNDEVKTPIFYDEIVKKAIEINFNMLSDKPTGSLLRTLAATKPAGNFLDLGTGLGLSTLWTLEGMDKLSSITTVDINTEFLNIAKSFLSNDSRVSIVELDGEDFIRSYKGPKFDMIFADAFPGKFSFLNETLDFLNPGGLYIIDDLLPQPNWPEGHETKIPVLIASLDDRPDIIMTKLNWSTGIIIVTKIA